ncbi:hypothetical protein EIP91_001941 [Steccherinum ochraceum]|uniref:BTB domain-containing protein n=1 Tax=Steccherinum ochraceum TaxID=92696 RepID=A0A4R0RTT5_9APHY|nr:hypothetical protein EIP91_001941 [Steccherinum ochraceum]
MRTDAHDPFNRPDRDVVLLSADQVKFACHKAVLSIASPFFADMFSLPQKPGSSISPSNDDSVESDETPIIPVAESSKVLDTLLRLIYPTDTPALDDQAHVAEVFCTAKKYQIPGSSNCLSILSPRFHEQTMTRSLEAFAILCMLGMEAEVSMVAKILQRKGKILSKQSVITASNSVKLATPHMDRFMKHGHAGAFFRLRQYLRTPQPFSASHRWGIAGDPPPILYGSQTCNGSPPAPRARPEKTCPALFSRIPPDVYLCSTGNPDDLIPVHKCMLFASSSVIAELVDSTSETYEDGLPIIRLPESAAVLSHLIQYCYSPIPSLITDRSSNFDANLLVGIVLAARAYSMHNVVEAMKLVLHSFLLTDPIQAYYVTVACSWETEARKAARYSLNIKHASDTYVTIMERLPAEVHAAFVRYHLQCKVAVDNAITLPTTSSMMWVRHDTDADNDRQPQPSRDEESSTPGEHKPTYPSLHADVLIWRSEPIRHLSFSMKTVGVLLERKKGGVDGDDGDNSAETYLDRHMCVRVTDLKEALDEVRPALAGHEEVETRADRH